MLVPRDSLVDFVMQYAEASDTSSTPFFHETSRVVWFVKCFIARISEQAIGEQFLPVLRELCARIWQLDQARGLALLPKSVVLSLLKAVTRAQDLKFLEQATSRLGGCPPLKFFEWIFQKVASGGLQLPAIEKRHVLFIPEREFSTDGLVACWLLLRFPQLCRVEWLSSIH